MIFKILREYEIKLYNELIKRLKTESTSFAINRGNKYKGWALVSEKGYQRVPAIYKEDGSIEELKPGTTNMGLRLIVNYSEIKNKCKNIKNLGDGYAEVEYGEYPQDVVDLDKQISLDYDLLKGKITGTGKEYTSHDNAYGCSTTLKEVVDEYGNKYVNKNNIWYNVKPVKWITDEKNNIAMSKYILTGGVSFGDLNPTRYHYEYMLQSTGNVYGYLKALVKELEPSIVLRKLDLTIPLKPFRFPNEPCDPIPGRSPWEITDPVPIKSPFTPYDPRKGPRCEEKVKKIGTK